MTAKKKAPKSDQLPTTRYRQKDQAVDVIEGAAILEHTGDPSIYSVTQEDDGEYFAGQRITASSYLLFNELGNPLALLDAADFKARYEFDAGASGSDTLRGELAEARTMIKKLEDRVLEQDALIDDLRKAGGGPSDAAAIEVLRAIMRIEPAQLRDDGGRIIHLNRNVLDRVIALL